ncbi:MAG: hypothetical protein WC777_02915 [Candidatus Gracilibacteria bacterium]
MIEKRRGDVIRDIGHQFIGLSGRGELEGISMDECEVFVGEVARLESGQEIFIQLHGNDMPRLFHQFIGEESTAGAYLHHGVFFTQFTGFNDFAQDP